MALSYKDAGVDIDRGDELVDRIAPIAKATRTKHVLGGVGGFAGLCSIPAGIQDPILVSGTDGVGTKLNVAFALGKHGTIGQDLVAMCVNDILTSGARPLFFLDYFATSKLDVDVAEAVVRGIADGCKLAGCALIGGETAELPGMYREGEYDLAGFSVGVVARADLIDGTRAREGDVVLGLASSGLHSNGYSLARKVLGNALADRPPELGGETVGDVLLTPTRIYVAAITALLEAKVVIHAMSHITGGGIPGNLPRVLPEGLGVRISQSHPRAPIFDLVERLGPVTKSEMRRTFNDGLGFVVIVPQSEAERALVLLSGAGERAKEIGRVVAVPLDREFEARVEWPESEGP